MNQAKPFNLFFFVSMVVFFWTRHIFINRTKSEKKIGGRFDALEKVLRLLRPVTRGRLLTVFGCGGDRDKTKRPRMAKIAEQLADQIIVTSDNPRTENADQIIADILEGFTDPNADFITTQPDRRKAIELAIKNAQPDDIILLAGKGHETYQIIGTEKIDFNDRKIAAEFIEAKLNS